MKTWYEISNGFLVRPNATDKSLSIIITNNEQEPATQYKLYEKHIARLMNLAITVLNKWCMHKLEKLSKEEPINDEEAKAKQNKLKTLALFKMQLSQTENILTEVINKFELDD